MPHVCPRRAPNALVPSNYLTPDVRPARDTRCINDPSFTIEGVDVGVCVYY
jgi:hypothetical protein